MDNAGTNTHAGWSADVVVVVVVNVQSAWTVASLSSDLDRQFVVRMVLYRPKLTLPCWLFVFVYISGRLAAKCCIVLVLYCLISLCYMQNNIICISMGGQLDGNFRPGSLPHKFILIVTSRLFALWWIIFFLCLYRESLWEHCCCRCGADRSTWHADDRADSSELDLEAGRLKTRLAVAGPGVPECCLCWLIASVCVD